MQSFQWKSMTDSSIEKPKLKIGYTTGTHSSAVFKTAINTYFKPDNLIDHPFLCPTELPDDSLVDIVIESIKIENDVIITGTKKTDNDDLDVTKGCIIRCILTNSLDKLKSYLNPLEHNPHQFSINNITISIFAGKGVGIVQKKGLKVPIGYPAINPVPLEMMKRIAKRILDTIHLNITFYIAISVLDGVELAKQTANPKIGISGGLSILGTKGIVKPVSVRAYIDTINTEISVAEASKVPALVYTLGNSSLNFAQNFFNLMPESIIEVGNFIYEAITLLTHKDFQELYFVANLGKMTKVAQGYKNTHNQYGKINFNQIIQWLIKEIPELEHELKDQDFNTTKAITDYLIEIYPERKYKDVFYNCVNKIALNQIIQWVMEIKHQSPETKLKYINVFCIDENEYWKISGSIND